MSGQRHRPSLTLKVMFWSHSWRFTRKQLGQSKDSMGFWKRKGSVRNCAACGHGCIHTALWQRGCSLVQQIITYKQDVLFFHLLQCFFVGPWAVWAGHRLKVRICPTMWISAGEYCCQTPLLPKSEMKSILIKQQENEPDTWWYLNCIGDHSNEGSVIFPS